MSLNDGSKEVENGESWTYFAARMSSCRLDVCRACVMYHNLLGYSSVQYGVHRVGVDSNRLVGVAVVVYCY